MTVSMSKAKAVSSDLWVAESDVTSLRVFPTTPVLEYFYGHGD